MLVYRSEPLNFCGSLERMIILTHRRDHRLRKSPPRLPVRFECQSWRSIVTCCNRNLESFTLGRTKGTKLLEGLVSSMPLPTIFQRSSYAATLRNQEHSRNQQLGLSKWHLPLSLCRGLRRSAQKAQTQAPQRTLRTSFPPRTRRSDPEYGSRTTDAADMNPPIATASARPMYAPNLRLWRLPYPRDYPGRAEVLRKMGHPYA